MTKSMKAPVAAFLLATTILSAAHGDLDSPFKSTVPGISISNAHVLVRDSRGQALLVRGRAPKSKKELQELKEFGIEEFLIFKNDTKGEVAQQIKDLQALGYAKKDLVNVPFPWKDLRDTKASCDMTLQALLTMQKAEKAGRPLYFHCTVGEDRTGYIAGLYLLATGRSRDLKQVFRDEMCAHGYEAGDPHKPIANVVKPIRETLTPTFLMMADLVMKKGLSKDLCKDIPAKLTPFATQGLTCGKSALLDR